MFTALLLVTGSRAAAQLQDYNAQLFDYTYGIRPGNIISLTRDNLGFLWIPYPRQIQRFDGRSTENFTPKGPFENLFCDEAGRIWVTTSRQVYLFDRAKQEFRKVEIEAVDSLLTIGHVFKMPERRTWLLTSKAFFEFDTLHQVFTRVMEDLPVPPPYNTAAFAYRQNTIYFGHAGWIYRYNTRTSEMDSLPDMNMRRFYALNEELILVATWNLSSYFFDFKKDTTHRILVRTKEGGPVDQDIGVRSLVKVSPYKFIIASREGLMNFDTRLDTFEPIDLYTRGKLINTKDLASALHYDEDWFVWMTTPEGIWRFSLFNKSFGLMQVHDHESDLPLGIDNIRSITEDETGLLWLGTGHGFYSWNRHTNEKELFLPDEGSSTGLAYPSIRGIAYDGKHIILAPADLGIWIFNPKNKTYKRPKYANDQVKSVSLGDFFDGITALRNGDFILTGRDALYLLDRETYTLSFIQVDAAKENTNYALEGKNGEIWLTTMKGLHLITADLSASTPIPLPNDNRFVSACTMLPDNRLLFSVEDGLYTAALHQGKVEIKKYAEAFDNIYLSILFMDIKGILWAASDQGIYRYDPKLSTINLYDYSDNLQGYGFNGNASLISRDSILYLGGINGLNYFRPDLLMVDAVEFKVFIASVIIGDEKIFDIPDEQIVLGYTRRSIEVAFASPYFNNPEKLKYRYKLEGLDSEWKYTNNDQHLRFTSLPPGEYSLQLQASINNVDWFPSENSFSFRIKPPFWLTWWFMSLMLSVFSLSLGLFVRSRNRRVEEKMEELEAEQAINYFSTRMAENQSIDDLLWDVARNCIGRLQFEDCVIYLVDEDRQLLVQKAAHGPKSPERFQIVDPIEIRIGEGITGKVAETGIAEIINDTSKDPRYIVDDVRRYAEITVPIVAGGKVLGVIDCEHSKKGFFTQRHLTILTTIASLCASKIVKSKAEAEKDETERILMATKQQMADIEMQALRAQMNPHFIFNCLNSINRYIVKSDQATASLYLTRFAKLIRLILDNSNSKTVTLTNELEALRLYIEMESIRFEKQFDYSITVDEEVHPDHVYVPPLIIQPYVENAIWHGLLHKETAGHLKVHISRRNGSLLECMVEDNGVGRDKARELKSKSASNSKSLGMKLTESRLALLNKHAQWDASVEIMDLKSDNGEASGTRVILRIPVDA
jgi:putative methionine-R-sulfoxide reductase with GAF domain/ligand-binding sensor domain-containing protein/two-component sensor histidine kinase